MSVIIPNNFNGEKFQNKFSLPEKSFFVIGQDLFCDLLPNLQASDLLDCTDVGTTWLSQASLDRKQIKDEYINMIARLEQIESAGVIPFTQAGFTQLVNAVKDEATFQKRILKFLKILFG